MSLLKYLPPPFRNSIPREQLISAKTWLIDSLSSISLLALFSCIYCLLVRSTDTLDKWWPGFRFLLLKSFSFALQKCWQDFQYLNFTMTNLTFYSIVFISVGLSEHNQYCPRRGMEHSFLRIILLPLAKHHHFFHHRCI